MNVDKNSEGRDKKPFLGVNFVKCGAYGRLYRNKDQTAYTGYCPRCRRFVKIPIGKGGCSERFFIVECF
ncbi:MAG: hypothetical protein A2Y14_05255 [Verrucomicrobia bacterium GWF2_51_19]|nr:MAG: hypothetical protein A2Y14_05255 [Verrucomicrobia bacterium GWF2_51_19]HCJ12342.1 hypothetical protein [Opitutae bacterium]